MSQAVADALQDAPLLPRDAAAVELVKQYAALLDVAGPEELADVGPKLQRLLESLGMTPAGRGAKGGGQSVGPIAAKLDEFTERRTRKRPA